jgi:outer membrane protein OmpA-like peptidoglycan-associated protein
MAKPSCKCDPHELCEECPEWIFTLADLIMCMMGLFVLLWVLKPAPGETKQVSDAQVQSDARWLETVGEIRGGFGWVPDPASADPVDQVILAKRARLAGPGERGVSTRENKGAEGTDPETTTIRSGRESAVGGRLLFDAGSADLTRETDGALDQIARQIRGHRNIVMVKGHASLDDFADSASPAQRMDLSLRRAQAVADYLVSKGVSPDIVRVQGCSTFEPVAQRAYSSTGQVTNRRVEVEVTATLVHELQDPPQKARAPTQPTLDAPRDTHETPKTESHQGGH